MRHRLLRTSAVLLAANAVSLLALSLILFRLQAPVTFFRYDGTFLLSVVKNQAEWMSGLGAFTMDFLKGMGEEWFPFDTRLLPGFLVARLAGYGDWFPAIAATWFALEFAAGTILVGRAIGFELAVTVLAVWFALFGAMPYLVPAPAMERTWGNPNVLSLMAFVMVALALFLRIGRASRMKSAASAAGLLLVLVYLTFVTPLSMIVCLPVLGFFCAVGLTTTRDSNETRWKLIASAVIVSVYLLLFVAWLPGLFLDAKTTFFWSELQPGPLGWRSTSLLLEDPALRPTGVVFYAAAVLGGIATALRAAGMQRRFALGYLTFVALLWICTGALAVGFRWLGPGVSYLDWVIYPLHALFAAQLVYSCLLGILIPDVRAALPLILMRAAVLVPWAALEVWVPPYDRPLMKNLIPFRWPPLRTPFVDFLEHEIALRPGEPFRGRVVNLAGARFDPQFVNAPFFNQHSYDAMAAVFLGNDHREYGFWFYDIPTLDETNHVASPFFHLLMSRLLNPQGALFARQHETATLFKPDILAQLGVRYVVTEEPLPDRKPVRTINLVPNRSQYLYELEDANVAGRAVSRVTIARTAGEALTRMRAADMDFRREALLFEPLPDEPLGAVSRSRLDVHRGFLTVSAEAPGRALLVLPVEFSRCLEFTWGNASAPPPLALRANLDQTAILFDRRLDARIALRNGPFANPLCRLRDFHDAVRVELGQAG